MANPKVVSGLVETASHQPRAGVLVRALLSQGATIAGTSEVVPLELTALTAPDGTYQFSLYSNYDLTPAGTYYTVREDVHSGAYYEFAIVVPASAGPFAMSNIQVAPPAPVPPAALDSAVVHLANPETITGQKTFSQAPIVPASSFPESAVTSLPADLASKANDAAVVHNTGNESVAGTKTFTSAPAVPDASFTEAKVTNLTTDLAAKAADSAVVHNTGAEAVAGVKTFSSAPVVPAAAFPESAIANLTTDLAAKATDTAVVHLAGTETMTGDKVHSGRLTLTKDFVHSVRTATEAELVSGLDASLAETVYVALTANRVMGAPINPVAGHRMKVVFTEDATGGRTVTLPSAVVAPGWTINLSANANTELPLEYNGTTSKWLFAANPPLGTAASPIQGVVEEWGLSTFNVKSPQSPTPAKGDGITDVNGAIASGTAALSTTSTVGPWVSLPVGNVVVVMGAGYNGQPLLSTVSANPTSKTITLADNAQTTVTSGGTVYVAGTNDTAAFTAALTALPSAGGAIEIPNGVYWINSDLIYTLSSNQHLRLEGIGEAVIISSAAEPGAQQGAITLIGGNATERITLRNFKLLTGNGITNGLGKHVGILLKYPAWPNSAPTVRTLQRYVVEDITIQGWSASGMRPVYTQNGRIINCTMSQNRQAGMFLLGDLNVVVFGGDYSSNVTSSLGGDYGIAFDSSSVVPYADACKILCVQANNNGRKGLDSHHSHNTVFAFNTCKGNGYNGIYAVAEDLTKDTGDIQIIGNNIDMAGANATLNGRAIEIGSFGTPDATQKPGAFIVSDNIIKNADSGTTASCAVMIHNPTTGPPASKVSITGNTITNGGGTAGTIIQTDGGAVATPFIKIADNIMHAVTVPQPIWLQQVTNLEIDGNTIQVDAAGGVYTWAALVPAGAIGSISDNTITGASPSNALAVTNSGTLRTFGNSLAGVALADSAVTAPFTVAASYTFDSKGHSLAIKTGLPTLTVVNANVANAVVTGNDEGFTVTFDVITGTITANTDLFTVNFAQTYGVRPTIVLTNSTTQNTGVWYHRGAAAGTFIARCANSLAVATGYAFDAIVKGRTS